MIRRQFIVMALLLSSAGAYAQRIAVATNLLGWANLATINAELSFAPGRHITVNLQGEYNNWNFGSIEKGNPFQNRVRGASAGVRWWPWNIYSGWWLGAGARCEEYNRGGLFRRRETEEGLAVGGGLSFGYSLLLSRHWNLDFGIGGWCGGTKYSTYACPRCGVRTDEGKKFFVLPSADTQVSIVYVF